MELRGGDHSALWSRGWTDTFMPGPQTYAATLSMNDYMAISDDIRLTCVTDSCFFHYWPPISLPIFRFLVDGRTSIEWFLKKGRILVRSNVLKNIWEIFGERFIRFDEIIIWENNYVWLLFYKLTGSRFP